MIMGCARCKKKITCRGCGFRYRAGMAECPQCGKKPE